MKVNLYLHEGDFVYNGVDDEVDLKQRFVHLMNDLSKIYQTDVTLYFSSLLPSTNVYPEENLFQFAERALCEEEKGFFYALWDEDACYFSMDREELESKTHYMPDEKECNARVVLNDVETQEHDSTNYITFDVYKVIYNRQSWNTLQRQILGNHPEDAASFVARCRECFDKLKFGVKCRENMERSVSVCPRKIVYYLSCINDCFLEFLKGHPNKKSTNDVLADFAGKYGMDRAGSLQRKSKDKNKYIFDFREENKKYVCDAHFKIQHADCGGNVKEIARIYIYYGNAESPEKVVWVGSMGNYHA